jgi:signal transduction histidine kinase
MLASGAMQVVGPVASAAHELTLETPAGEVMVFGDDDRIVTIISNLLENAIKYSPDGGKIQCIVAVADGEAHLTVIDHGVGIEASELPRLFNRFERIQNQRTSHVSGAGIGLYLSRELARQHGGDIRVESQPGTGSTFTLVLPLAIAQSEAPQEPMEPEPSAPRLHVVAAEGEADSESRLA